MVNTKQGCDTDDRPVHRPLGKFPFLEKKKILIGSLVLKVR